MKVTLVFCVLLIVFLQVIGSGQVWEAMERYQRVSWILAMFIGQLCILITLAMYFLGYKPRNLKKEIIVINDASTDGTKEILEKNKKKFTHLVNHKKNQGKGAAIQTAQKLVQGDIVLIQESDLEYKQSRLWIMSTG